MKPKELEKIMRKDNKDVLKPHRKYDDEISIECEATWDSSEYYEALYDVRDELSYEDYWSFYYAFRAWRYEYGRAWKYGGAWQAKLKELVCEVDNSLEMCISDLF